MPTPNIMYGTAWKEDDTKALVAAALTVGFRAIDTANQRKHYNEAGVGEALSQTRIPRDELFLQSKYTYQDGQDHRLPYDPEASPGEQVEQSFASSLVHLKTNYLDSFILHGPSSNSAWTDVDRQVWSAMEVLYQRRQARVLGISNITLAQLEALVASASVQPSFVQNRCYARAGWDREIRVYCKERDIVYQGFSLLTANRKELALPKIAQLARRHGATVPQLIFRFAQDLGVLPLTGTKSATHMAEDLATAAIDLTLADLKTIETIAR